MLLPAVHQIDPRRLDAGMSQQVRQLHDIPADPVPGHREQMPQVMRKPLRWLHPRFPAQRLHLLPDLAAGNPFPLPRQKDLPRPDPLLFRVSQQLLAQLPRQEDRPDLPFQRDFRPSALQGLHGDIFHLRYPDPRGADGLHQQSRALLPTVQRGLYQPVILRAGQLPLRAAKETALDVKELHPALAPAHEIKKGIQGGEHGIDGDGPVVFLQQLIFPGGHVFLHGLPFSQPRGKGSDVAQIFFDGAPAFFLPNEIGAEIGDHGLPDPIGFFRCFRHDTFSFSAMDLTEDGLKPYPVSFIMCRSVNPISGKTIAGNTPRGASGSFGHFYTSNVLS